MARKKTTAKKARRGRPPKDNGKRADLLLRMGTKDELHQLLNAEVKHRSFVDPMASRAGTARVLLLEALRLKAEDRS